MCFFMKRIDNAVVETFEYGPEDFKIGKRVALYIGHNRNLNWDYKEGEIIKTDEMTKGNIPILKILVDTMGSLRDGIYKVDKPHISTFFYTSIKDIDRV